MKIIHRPAALAVFLSVVIHTPAIAQLSSVPEPTSARLQEASTAYLVS
jgi:hypothetical protein